MYLLQVGLSRHDSMEGLGQWRPVFGLNTAKQQVQFRDWVFLCLFRRQDSSRAREIFGKAAATTEKGEVTSVVMK